MICQTTPWPYLYLLLTVSADHYSRQITKPWLNCTGAPSQHAKQGGKCDSWLHPRSELSCGRVKRPPWWPVTHHSEIMVPGAPDLFYSTPRTPQIWAKKKVSRSLLGTGNYPWGPWGPILSGCTLTRSLNPFNKARVIPTTGAEQQTLIRAPTHSNRLIWDNDDHSCIDVYTHLYMAAATCFTHSDSYNESLCNNICLPFTCFHWWHKKS